MEKIKTFIKEVNILAVFSFTTAVLALYYWFTPRECSIALSLIGLEAFIMGVISFVRIETKKTERRIICNFRNDDGIINHCVI